MESIQNSSGETKLQIVVVATFGLESIVKREILKLGYTIDKVENGSIFLEGDMEVVSRLNIFLRCADRVYILLSQFNAVTWDELYCGVNAIPWHRLLSCESTFPVNAKSIKSKLFSLSDIQSISKKAIVNQMKSQFNVEWFKECGPTYPIHINILSDSVSVLVDTSGVGMHRRGYRENANEAPLKETLAAGLVLLSNWNARGTLYDPFCGTGTILIEAAMYMRNIPPGLSRKSIYETWEITRPDLVKSVRKSGYEGIVYDRDVKLIGTDIQGKTIAIARANAELAGVDDCIDFQVRDVRNWEASESGGIIITNPPYGERLEDARAVTELHKILSRKVSQAQLNACYVLTAHEQFEMDFGQKADKNRKLFNGNLKCYYYQYSFSKSSRS